MAIETTKVLHCNCVHKVQDALYGPGMRLHNRKGSAGTAKDKAGKDGWRCTVCRSERATY